MQQDPFTPPEAAFTRSVPIRFSHCDPAGIVYFPHYFNMFNGLIEDWYTEELGYNYAEIIMGSSLPSLSNTSRMATSAALAFSESKIVSTRSKSAPPAMRARTCCV